MAFLGDCGEIPRDYGKAMVAEVYADKINQGYEFVLMLHKNFVDESVDYLKSIGLEVFIGEQAFWQGGCDNPSSSTILIRRL